MICFVKYLSDSMFFQNRARITLCTDVSQTTSVSRDLNDFGTLVRERVYQEKMEMRRFVDDMDMYERRLV